MKAAYDNKIKAVVDLYEERHDQVEFAYKNQFAENLDLDDSNFYFELRKDFTELSS